MTVDRATDGTARAAEHLSQSREPLALAAAIRAVHLQIAKEAQAGVLTQNRKSPSRYTSEQKRALLLAAYSRVADTAWLRPLADGGTVDCTGPFACTITDLVAIIGWDEENGFGVHMEWDPAGNAETFSASVWADAWFDDSGWNTIDTDDLDEVFADTTAQNAGSLTAGKTWSGSCAYTEVDAYGKVTWETEIPRYYVADSAYDFGWCVSGSQ